MSDLLREPEELAETAEHYSNFDHKMPEGVEDQLRAGTHWMSHCAYDHWGAIWFADGQFHERVMRHRAHVATISAGSLQGVIDEVNEQYGRG